MNYKWKKINKIDEILKNVAYFPTIVQIKSYYNYAKNLQQSFFL